MESQKEIYSDTNFPERLFVLGAGPSLELLYPYREEMDKWGYWAVQRSDLVQPFLDFTDPLYTIRYFHPPERSHHVDPKTYGINLQNTLGDVKSGGSIGAFISHFQKFGGKELFLFGYDGTNTGYWRGQSPTWCAKWNAVAVYKRDSDDMNKRNWGSTKLYHLGKTNNNFMTEISIAELMELKRC